MRTVTVHRPSCPRPGWDVEPSRSLAGVSIKRCQACGAVELRTETPPHTTDRPTEGNRP